MNAAQVIFAVLVIVAILAIISTNPDQKKHMDKVLMFLAIFLLGIFLLWGTWEDNKDQVEEKHHVHHHHRCEEDLHSMSY